MTRKISDETMKVLLSDPFYKKCCISGRTPVQFHHNFIFQGQQVDEPWAILPLHKDVHDVADQPYIKQQLDRIMLNRATDEELERHSKAISLKAKRNYLNELYDNPED